MKDNYIKARPKNNSIHMFKSNKNILNQPITNNTNLTKDILDLKRNITDKSSIGSVNTNIEVLTNQSNSSYTNYTQKTNNTKISNNNVHENLTSRIYDNDKESKVINKQNTNLFKEYSNNMPKKQSQIYNNYNIQKEPLNYSTKIYSPNLEKIHCDKFELLNHQFYY